VTCGGRRQIADVMSGSSYYSQNDLRLHFGLGQAAVADRVELAWPSGAKDALEKLAANHLYVIHEGKGVVTRTPLGKGSWR
jgi:hypothetical protein